MSNQHEQQVLKFTQSRRQHTENQICKYRIIFRPRYIYNSFKPPAVRVYNKISEEPTKIYKEQKRRFNRGGLKPSNMVSWATLWSRKSTSNNYAHHKHCHWEYTPRIYAKLSGWRYNLASQTLGEKSKFQWWRGCQWIWHWECLSKINN